MHRQRHYLQHGNKEAYTYNIWSVDVSGGEGVGKEPAPSEEAFHQRAESIPGEVPCSGGGMSGGARAETVCRD